MLDPVKQPPAFDGCVASVKNANRYDVSIQHVVNENILKNQVKLGFVNAHLEIFLTKSATTQPSIASGNGKPHP